MRNYIVILLIYIIFFHQSYASAQNFDKNSVQQTVGLVNAGNKPIVLLGDQIAIGQQAPDFKVVNENFSPINLNSFSSKIVIISVVPSLDTGVCSLQTKRFNTEVTRLPEDVIILTISNDLPFAQKRFCQQEKVDKILVLSDAVWRDFGYKYGLLIKDMGLLARAVLIIDKQGILRYKELVSNISSHPNYDEALQAIALMVPVKKLDDTIEIDTTQINKESAALAEKQAKEKITIESKLNKS